VWNGAKVGVTLTGDRTQRSIAVPCRGLLPDLAASFQVIPSIRRTVGLESIRFTRESGLAGGVRMDVQRAISYGLRRGLVRGQTLAEGFL